MILSGAALLLVCAGAAGVMGWAIITKFDPLPHVPVWAVRMETRSASEVRSLSALAEVVRRMKTGSLLDKDVQLVVDHAIARISAREEPPAQWSEFIEFVRGRGQLSDEKWVAYAKAAVDIEIAMGERVRRGEKLQIRPALFGRRVSPAVSMGPAGRVPYSTLRVKLWMEHGRVGTRVTRGAPGISITSEMHRNTRGSMGTSLNCDGPPGPSTVQVTFRLEVLDGPSNKIIGGWNREFERTVEIIGRDQASIPANTNFSPDTIRQSLNVHQGTLAEDGRMSMNLEVNGPPSGLGFDIFFRPLDGPGRTEVPGGRISVEQGDVLTYCADAMLPSSAATRVDVILRPSIQAAEINPCVTSVWMGSEIVFRDVPLQWRR